MRNFSILVTVLLLSARSASAACALTEISSAAFSSTSSSASQIAGIGVACGSEYRIGLDAGAWLAGTRRLHDGKGHYIAYRLWQDRSAAAEWGDSGLGTVTYPATSLNAAAGAASPQPVFGSLLDAESAPPGDYSDTVRVILAWPPYSAGNQQTAALAVSLHVTESCSLDVSGIHGFGTWPVGGTNLSGVALGSVSVTCSAGIHYVLGLDAGRHYDGRRRRLISGGNAIPYTLRTSSNGPEWGDAGLNAVASDYAETHPAQAVRADGSGQIQNFFVWGDADSAHAPDGMYADSVTVTVVW